MRDVVDDAPADEAIEILLELRSLASFDPSLEAPSLWELAGGNGPFLAALERRLERALARAGSEGEA